MGSLDLCKATKIVTIGDKETEKSYDSSDLVVYKCRNNRHTK